MYCKLQAHGRAAPGRCRFATAGCPGDRSYFIFNGDFVDRGAWGLETLALLLAWKLALPARVLLLRGNHESATCTMIYGFKEELKAKYGKGAWQVRAAQEGGGGRRREHARGPAAGDVLWGPGGSAQVDGGWELSI